VYLLQKNVSFAVMCAHEVSNEAHEVSKSRGSARGPRGCQGPESLQERGAARAWARPWGRDSSLGPGPRPGGPHLVKKYANIYIYIYVLLKGGDFNMTGK
jgi:hypothetical protein